MSFPPGTEMFQFPGFACWSLCIQPNIPKHPAFDRRPETPPAKVKTRRGNRRRGEGGFPHSEMSGSKGARTSPDLIAACHVLHRLPAPRHPSEALMRLIDLAQTHARGKPARTVLR